ncbi:MAG: DUF3696 domain-containing protein [Pirellulaceae bacterium]|nr:DUF3696 domain-containing protein [Pirellulaceae bacterium]
MITAIEIENFKGIGERQRIEFAAITLLFGANSAGKSTIAHALHYLLAVLESGNGDVDEIISTNGELRLGGFENLVYKHDDNRRISIRADFLQHSKDQFELSIPDIKLLTDLDFDDTIFSETTTVGIEIEVGKYFEDPYYRERPDFPIIINFRLFVDNELFLETEATNLLYDEDKLGRFANLCKLNIDHPSLRKIDERTVLSLLCERANLEVDNYDWENGDAAFEIDSSLGALPTSRSVKRSVYSDKDLDDDDRRFFLCSNIQYFVKKIAADAIDHSVDLLRKTCHVGPVRDIPVRGTRTSIRSNRRSWYRGHLAWQLLTDVVQMLDIMEEIREEDRRWYELNLQNIIGSPYTVLRVGCWYSNEGDWHRGTLNAPEQFDVELRVKDIRTGAILSLPDVGAGIAQIVPVLIATRLLTLPIVFIEQPELHIHPAQQARFGDVLAAQTSKWQRWYTPRNDKQSDRRTIIVETHSELLLLRLLKRIGETFREESRNDVPRLNMADVSVLFVEAKADGTTFTPFPLSSTGNFIGAWPEGFFDEREKELL